MSSRDHETIPVVPQKTRASAGLVRPVPGEALPPALQAEMGERFGVDFGQVRVHRDGAANRQAQRESAQAFTLGNDITFATGRYNPATATGQQLIAHELAHVAQQRRPGAVADAEQRADRAASAVTRGDAIDANTLGGAPLGVQAKPGDKPDTDTQKPVEQARADWRHSTFTIDKFDVDKDKLSAAHLKQLDDIAFSIGLHVGMLARGKARIEIIGHADTTGKDPHNEELGQKRADRVREVLEKKLTVREGEPPLNLEWAVRSAGEQDLLVPTPDNTLEPRNRAVEIKVTFESLPIEKPVAKIDLDPRKIITEVPKPTPPRRQDDDWWQKSEAMRKKAEEYDRTHPQKKESLQDVITGGIEKAVDPLIKKLPISDSKKKWLREKLRDGVEAGLEKACESAIDAAGVQGSEAEALKSACKAAIKEKGESK